MKSFCLYCGDKIFSLTNVKSRFCSKKCKQKFLHERYGEKTSPRQNFNLFKNIVAASDSYDEFLELWKKYFEDNHHDK